MHSEMMMIAAGAMMKGAELLGQFLLGVVFAYIFVRCLEFCDYCIEPN